MIPTILISIPGRLKALISRFTSHAHTGGEGAQIAHTNLSSIGSNSHTQIDTFIGTKAAANGLASLDASSKVVQDPVNATATATASKIPIAEGTGTLAVGWIPQLSHTSLSNIGSNSHTQIDSHLTATATHGATGAVVGTTNTQTLTNKTLSNYTESIYAISGTAITITASNGPIQTWTLTANSTASISMSAGQSVTVVITSGAYSVTWSGVTWIGPTGSPGAPSFIASSVNVIELFKIGSIVYGCYPGNDG